MIRRLTEPSAAELIRRLKSFQNPAQAEQLRRFFKTGPGEYGEGDRFWGLYVPQIRTVLAQFPGVSLSVMEALLASPIHEVRFCAVAALVRAYGKGDAATRRTLFDFYLSKTDRINNWDLVDVSAPGIVGRQLPLGKGRRVLGRLVKSESLWERRIAMVSTLEHIRQGNLDNTFWLAQRLLDDREDLMHKATGWMLREAGKRDEAALRDFLTVHAARMPRTMLRYAIEKFSPAQRKQWLSISKSPARSRISKGRV